MVTRFGGLVELLDPSGASFPILLMECRLAELVLSDLEEGTEPHPELLSIVLTDLDSLLCN